MSSHANPFQYLLNGYMPSYILALAAVVCLCWHKLSVQLDPAEPKLLKPAVPYIGHIIGMFKYSGGGYFEKLAQSSNYLSIVTLPLINKKMYIITDPALISSAFRSKTLTFNLHILELSQKMFGLSDETMEALSFPGDDTRPAHLDFFFREMHGAIVGKHLRKLNSDALNHMIVTINGLGKTSEVGGLYFWLRDMMTMAICNALLGSQNPMIEDPNLKDALWDFDTGVMAFLFSIPEFLAPKAYKGRRALQNAMVKYHTGKSDSNEDTSELIRVRGNVYRSANIPESEMGKMEISMLSVATANAIPSLFWLICFICSDTDTTAIIREELCNIITTTVATEGKREVTIDTTKFDAETPVLVSSYRETLRLADTQVSVRRATTNTMISDGKKIYLLRKGVDIQIPAGVSQRSTAIWGPDALSFDAKRNLKTDEKIGEKAKEQRQAYIPFGGGKHLCPGRNFAFVEILGTVAVLLLGFEVKGTDDGLIVVPELGSAKMGEGVKRPTGKELEVGAKLVRREGWEDVTWKFIC